MKTKKSLGQNFLKSESALNAMIQTGNLDTKDFVVEIGPGRGALTKKLLETGAKVLAIEKDFELVSFLRETFSKEINSGQLEILEEDILTYNLQTKTYKLISNIPYYITGEIIEKFLSAKNQPEKMVLLVQKEVADRITEKDSNKGSILSNSVKIFCEPKIIKKVSAGSFVPVPKVDSAIVSFENVSKNKLKENQITEKDFFKVLKTGFSHKRKILISNLKTISEKNLEKVFEKCNLDPKIRAENLKISDWICLVKNL